jgi:hypothetical protein
LKWLLASSSTANLEPLPGERDKKNLNLFITDMRTQMPGDHLDAEVD